MFHIPAYVYVLLCVLIYLGARRCFPEGVGVLLLDTYSPFSCGQSGDGKRGARITAGHCRSATGAPSIL